MLLTFWKPFEPEKLLEVIERASKKSTKLISAFEFIADYTERLAKLTDKELEVMQYIVRGNTNKEISVTLKQYQNHRASSVESF